MPLQRGRTLQASDTRPGAPKVVLINESLAKQVWPDEDPIGKRISTWTGLNRRTGARSSASSATSAASG